MSVAADSIRQLTRAYLGARVYQGLLFWFVLVHNINMALINVASPRLRMWLAVGAIVSAATLGTFYRWRFGRVEPPRPAPSRRPFEGFKYGVFGATALALLVLAAVLVFFIGGKEIGARPIDLAWLLTSGSTAVSLARSRGERHAWLLPVLASSGLFATLVVPALQPFQSGSHAGMAAVLVFEAVQLHLFLVRGFRHAHV
jgi:hypothetical protein